MRAIDADALIEKCGDWYVEEGTESGFIGTLKNLLATEPTIHPVATDINDGDLISRKMVLALPRNKVRSLHTYDVIAETINVTDIEHLPSEQPQYEELTPEEAAPEIASGSILRASYWLDVMIALKQMGYAICRKKG